MTKGPVSEYKLLGLCFPSPAQWMVIIHKICGVLPVDDSPLHHKKTRILNGTKQFNSINNSEIIC